MATMTTSGVSATTGVSTVDQSRQEALQRQIEKNSQDTATQQDKLSEAAAQVRSSAAEPAANARDAWDLQREQVNSRAEEDRRAREEALRRRMGAQNISGSGINEKAQRNLESEVAKTSAQQRSAIDIAELQAQEEARKAETQQKYAKELEALKQTGAQTLTGMTTGSAEKIAGITTGSAEKIAGMETTSREKIAFADLSLREKDLAERGRQFDNELDFKKWAQSGEWTQDEIDRTWQAIENDKDRISRENVAYAGLDIQGKQLAENARQFDTKQAWEEEAKRLDIDQATIDRTWKAAESAKALESAEKIAFAQLSLKEKEDARAAIEFDSELEWKKQATQLGLDDTAALRAWQSAESLKEQYSRERMAQWDNDNRITVQKMVTDAQMGVITLQDSLERQKATWEAIGVSYYNQGMVAKDTGKGLSTIELNALKNTDPLAYASYQAGLSGRAYEDYKTDLESQIEYRNAAIMNLNTSGADFQSQLAYIFKSFATSPEFKTNLSGTMERGGSNLTPTENIAKPSWYTGNSWGTKYTTYNQTEGTYEDTFPVTSLSPGYSRASINDAYTGKTYPSGSKMVTSVIYTSDGTKFNKMKFEDGNIIYRNANDGRQYLKEIDPATGAATFVPA